MHNAIDRLRNRHISLPFLLRGRCVAQVHNAFYRTRNRHINLPFLLRGRCAAQVHNAFEQHVASTDVEGFMRALGFDCWTESSSDSSGAPHSYSLTHLLKGCTVRGESYDKNART